jgi:hypothetical protein
MVPIVFWLLAAAGLKKADDHRRSYISEEDYRRLQKEADERDGLKKQKSLTDRSQEALTASPSAS